MQSKNLLQLLFLLILFLCGTIGYFLDIFSLITLSICFLSLFSILSSLNKSLFSFAYMSLFFIFFIVPILFNDHNFLYSGVFYKDIDLKNS